MEVTSLDSKTLSTAEDVNFLGIFQASILEIPSIWAFEAIPSLGKKFAKKYGIPRMLAWEMPKRLTSYAVDNVLESKELEVKSTLIPTEAELEEVYWQELTTCVEQEDTVF
ncbi:Ubiquitin-like protease domain-containing protein [Forsythia ovata]|uniref:Ubiquitin-like protease domain-containing protein n=1 Tax=Forsythia ovata TaxID=205694 RepID=A0ABD1W9K1_9LAMI